MIAAIGVSTMLTFARGVIFMVFPVISRAMAGGSAACRASDDDER